MKKNKIWKFLCLDNELKTGFHYGFYVVAPDLITATDKLEKSGELTLEGINLRIVSVELQDNIRGKLVE